MSDNTAVPTRCPKCGGRMFRDNWRTDLYACINCGGSFRIPTRRVPDFLEAQRESVTQLSAGREAETTLCPTCGAYWKCDCERPAQVPAVQRARQR